MLNHRKQFKKDLREKTRGGSGAATYLYMVEGAGAVQQNINMLAEVTLPPGSSIGIHSHISETEIYIFLKGSGMANDNGTERRLCEGDVLVTGPGQAHGIFNTGDVPMVFHAIRIT